MNATSSEFPTAPLSPTTPRTSRLAIISLVLGILGFLIVPALAGLVCGIVALVQISRSVGTLKGHGIALAGTIVSGLMLAVMPVVAILAAMLLPAMAKAKDKAQTIMSMNNAKQIALAMHLHASDKNDVLPEAANWCDALQPYVGAKSVFLRPRDQAAGQANVSSYAFNVRLSGAKISEVPPETVLVFEARSASWNAAGGPEMLRAPENSRDAVIIGFVDGHVESVVPGPRLQDLRWDP